MSVREVLSQHLDDYLRLVDLLLAALVQDPKNAAAVMRRLAQKEDLLQQAVEQLVRSQRLEKDIEAAQAELRQLDQTIVGYARALGELEQRLHEASTDQTTLKDLDGMATRQAFSVEEMLTFAQRAAQASFSPDQYVDKLGIARPRLPPCPTLEMDVQGSYLHLSAEELLLEIDKERLLLAEALNAETQPARDAGAFPGFQQVEAELEAELEAPDDWVRPQASLIHWRGVVDAKHTQDDGPGGEHSDSDEDLLDMGL